MRLGTILGLLVGCYAAVFAQQGEVGSIESLPKSTSGPAAYAGKLISRIDYIPALQPLPATELAAVLPFKVGDALDLNKVREAIRLLHATGWYGDVAIEASADANAPGGGVVLRIVTEVNYFLSSIRVDGEREPPNENQLVTASQLELGTVYHPEAIDDAIKRLTQRLTANGFYQAKVAPKITFERAMGEAGIVFDVNTGERARFKDPEFTGEFPQSTASLIRATGWHRAIGPLPWPGLRPLTESRLQSGIENVRRKLQGDDRLQAEVTLDRLEYDALTDRVTPYLTITSGPIIEVRVNGATAAGFLHTKELISRDKLRELVPIYQERSVDRSLLLEGERNIAAYLQSEGYFDSSVSFSQSEPGSGQFLVEYDVVLGERHKLVAVEITGNQYFDFATLRDRMTIQAASWLRWRYGRYSPAMRVRDENSIRNLYLANGFEKVKVVAEAMEGTLDHTEITVMVRIEEGPQILVKTLTLEGVVPEDETYIRSILQSAVGQPYGTANVAADRDAVLAYYYNNGYSDASFDDEEQVAPDGVNLRYTVKTGTRQFVRNVLVRGLVVTDPMLVSSRIRLKPGGVMSQSLIAESQQKLYDLGILTRVQTAVQNPDGMEASKNVIFFAQEAKKYSFNFAPGAEIARIGGGSANSLDGAAGATGFSPRVSLGVTRINFMGLGHTISLQTLASTQQRRALATYLAPQFKGRENLALTFSALFNDSRDVRTFDARRWETSVQLAERFTRSYTGQLRFTFRRVTLDPNSLKISPELIPLLARPVRVGSVGASLFRERRDDPVESHSGNYNSIDIAGASKAFGSQTSFTRVLMRNSTYYKVRKDVVLARSLQFGYIQRLGGQPEIPLAERFFSGGASSHRGFPDNQAGPRDPITGFPLGGSALLFHSTELRFPLIGDNLGGVLFHDMGNVYSDIRNISFRVNQRSVATTGTEDFNYMVHAVGFGIRYKTPIGPVRVDLAYAPNTPKFFGFSGTRDQLLAVPPGAGLCSNPALCSDQRISRFQFHFSLGQTF
ncbi:MAG: BamA/TamA family outer membrane protein [Acidobacteriota bacterium]